jgi:hypothetical protein
MLTAEKSPAQLLNERSDIDLIIDAPWIVAMSDEDLRMALNENGEDKDE